MSRPPKCRRVCTLPRCGGFRPMEDAPWSGTVTLGVDEYEVIRLIDLEGLTQEQRAAQMAVARTTVTGIYLSARRKLAQALVERKALAVAGGHYRLCDGGECRRRGHECPKKQKLEAFHRENRSDL